MEYAASDVDKLWSDDLELYGWIIEVSKFEKRYDLEPAIRRCLDHPDGNVRAGAINALGLYLHIDGFADEAKSYMNDKDSAVVMAAVLTWSFYYDGSKDPAVVGELLHIARDTQQDKFVRAGALGVIRRVLGTDKKFPTDTHKIVKAETDEEFESLIEWDAIDKYITSELYGP